MVNRTEAEREPSDKILSQKRRIHGKRRLLDFRSLSDPAILFRGCVLSAEC